MNQNGLPRLAAEATRAARQVKSDLRRRKTGSDGGSGKTRIRSGLTRTVALVEGHLLASGMWRFRDRPYLDAIDDHAKSLGIDLPELYGLVRNMKLPN